jgi:GNAT superfamily N-acetyltransferase
LFTKEFSICATNPDRRIYLLAHADEVFAAYAGARFYDQAVDENMYGTKQLLPTGWYLRGLKVHPHWRRIGVAREITKRRLEWLAKKTETVMVFLNDESKETLPMYYDFGFKMISDCWEFIDNKHKREGQRGVLLSLTFWNPSNLARTY